MSIRRPSRRHDRSDAVSWRTASDASPALQRLLDDASAPAHADELAGLAAALTAFAHTPQPRRNHVTSLLAKLLAAKAALAAAGSAAAVSGIALAAATGSLPAPLQNAAHDSLGAPAAATAHPTGKPTALPTPTESESPEPQATPSPSLVGLCRAYGAGVADAKGKALENPAFTVLITTAGGKDAVPAYCTALLATAPGGRPTALPTQAQGHKPATHPTGKPATHPTGAPETHPTGAPDAHPTGRP